ncbi:Ankyrin repeat and SOCS box protein 3 [Geodia barretti]|uniref:Ankyrin repeat and SOCS box protein 3 n=1 Tax=Geodia barretti TaxID=519541 RepID=A0AA35VZL0_GEOBA|nr:Ankyrin repeat and SOCS box protein 3 [Geodia barretti]
MSHLTFSCISLCHTFSYTQNGGTPLYVACQNGQKQTVVVLLKNGANVNLTCTVDPLSTPLGIAAEKGHTEIVEKLISAGAVINYQDKV